MNIFKRLFGRHSDQNDEAQKDSPPSADDAAIRSRMQVEVTRGKQQRSAKAAEIARRSSNSE